MNRCFVNGDCGCHGGVHFKCAIAYAQYEAADVEAANRADDVEEFNAIFLTALTQRDYDILSDKQIIDRGEVAAAILRRIGWA